MSDTTDGYFEFIDGLPDDVLGVRARGHITRAAYESTLIPAVEERIKAEGKINMLYVMGDDFDGLSVGAAWDDAKLGFLHLADFARVAVVTDVEWIRRGLKIFAPLLRMPVQVFHNADLSQAKDWISAREAMTGGSNVAADRKIAPLEDKSPI